MIFSPLSGKVPHDYHVTQVFGVNADRYAKYGFKGHNGIDLSCKVGTPLYAPDEGYAVIGDEGSLGYGKFIYINSLPYNNEGECRQITLGHLSSHLVQTGTFVHAGDLIGYSGATGDATGPHVHITYKKLAGGLVLNNESIHGQTIGLS